MATLAGNTIASTYPLLLKIDSSGIDGTLRAVEDGDGTDSALSIATDSVLVKGDGVKLYFYDADGGEHISANTGGVLSIAGASEIDLTATAIDINGTVDMSSTLAVGGDVTISASASTKPHFTITNTHGDGSAPQFIMKKDSASPADDDEVGRIYMYGDDDAGNPFESILIRGITTDVSNGDEDSRLEFLTYKAGAQVSTLSLNSGNVGIGTASPATKLHLSGAVGATSIIKMTVSDGTAWEFGERATAGHFTFRELDGNKDVLTMKSTGYVGIGTASPTAPLHIKGAPVQTSGARSAQLYIEDTTAFSSVQNSGIQFRQIYHTNGSITSTSAIVGLRTSTSSGNYGGALVFQTRANGGDLADNMIIGETGAVVNAKQPAFSANPASSQDNIAINTNVTVVFGTEVFDQGGNFASNTFTAPVTGKYQLNVNLRIDDIDSAANYYYVRINTSNRNYQFIYDPENGGTDRLYNDIGSFSVLADMDTSDTAYVVINQNGGTQQSDVSTESYFSGFLAC